MSQIGFVMLTHGAPNQIVRLVRALNLLYSDPPIVIHHDFDQSPADLSLSSNVTFVRPHFPTQWSKYSLVLATLSALYLLYTQNDRPDWFVLLSGSCYPTKPMRTVIADLETGGCDAYIDHQLIDPANLQNDYQRDCFGRYFSWNIGLPRLSRRFATPILTRIYSVYAVNNRRCYAGSQWFTANRAVAEHILVSEKNHLWLSEHLRHRHCPDETYFQTIICNEPQFSLSSTNYRYIDWPIRGPHPKLLDQDDLPSILASRAHFARKFAPDSPLLTRLDQHLGIC